MAPQDHKLDNPVWYSLTETHQPFAIAYDGMKFYHPDYCPFGGFIQEDKVPSALQQYARLTDKFFVVGNEPVISSGLALQQELVCRQMVLEAPSHIEISETIIELLPDHYQELFNLVNRVQPGTAGLF